MRSLSLHTRWRSVKSPCSLFHTGASMHFAIQIDQLLIEHSSTAGRRGHHLIRLGARSQQLHKFTARGVGAALRLRCCCPLRVIIHVREQNVRECLFKLLLDLAGIHGLQILASCGLRLINTQLRCQLIYAIRFALLLLLHQFIVLHVDIVANALGIVLVVALICRGQETAVHGLKAQPDEQRDLSIEALQPRLVGAVNGQLVLLAAGIPEVQ